MYAAARIVTGLNSYTPEARALFGAMTVAPSFVRRAQLNALLAELRRSDALSDLDLLGVIGADTQASKLNLISRGYDMTASATPPTFLADRGYTGIIASSTTLTASGYNPSSGGVKYALNDACAGIWTRTPASYDGATGRFDLTMGTTRMGRRGTTSNAQYTYRINDGTGANVILAGGVPDQAGHFTAMRTAAGAHALYRNGSSIHTGTNASTTLPTAFILFGSAGAYSDAELCAWYSGRSLSAAKLASVHTALSTYLTAIGAV